MPLEEHHVLVDVRDRVGEVRALVRASRLAVEEDLAAPGPVEARGEARDRRLARARRADERHAPAGFQGERKALDERRLAAVVAEGDVAELERAPAMGGGRGVASATRHVDARFGRVVQHVVQPREVAAQRLQLLRVREERVHRRRESREQHLERDQVAHAEGALHDERGAEAEHREMRGEPEQRRRLAQREHEALRADRRVHVLHLQADPLEEERGLLAARLDALDVREPAGRHPGELARLHRELLRDLRGAPRERAPRDELQREARGDHQREARIEAHHQHQEEARGDEVEREVREVRGDGLRDALVQVHARGDLAGRALRVEGHRQRERVREEAPGGGARGTPEGVHQEARLQREQHRARERGEGEPDKERHRDAVEPRDQHLVDEAAQEPRHHEARDRRARGR